MMETVAAETAENIAKVVAGRDAMINSGNQSVEQSGSGNVSIGQALSIRISSH
ncbi:MAG: hypothetical protein F6K47_22965 [Symploca sp. SIO2E6]|nr:hypothetical protein [Symploca sp. SIO2E6]